MKNISKLFAATIFVSLAAACGPSPEAVCDHVIELTKKEVGEEAAKAIDKDDCVKSAEREKEMKGMMKYNEQASCVVAAESLEALTKCE
jgi:NADH:ubiquinone oxidoreductase subunit B-like Fe-S oxidoreductase